MMKQSRQAPTSRGGEASEKTKRSKSRPKSLKVLDVAAANLRGFCYCGSVQYSVKADATVKRATFCHCESCRRAHSAPVYQVCYVLASDFHITAGQEALKACPFRGDPEKGSRSFCSHCGSRVCNVMTDGRVGFFPNTLEIGMQRALPKKFRPTLHHCPEEAVFALPDDGLTRQPNIYAKSK